MLPSSFQKWGLCVSLLFAHVLEVGPPTLKAYLNAPQEAGAHRLRFVCCHFTHVLFDPQTQLLQATVLVVVSSGLLPVPNSIRWTSGLGSLQGQRLLQQARCPVAGGAASQRRAVRALSASRHHREGGRQLPGARSDMP